ncbi:MAG: polysaccharide biosynthesis tyrosine autokinase [Acidimicrobiia bacterium]
MTTTPTTSLSLQSYLHVLRRQRRIVITVALLTTVLSILPALLADPVYASTASVRIAPLDSEGIFQGDNESANLPTDRARDLLTEIEILRSSPMRSAVLARLPFEVPDFGEPEVTQVGFSEIVEIRITAGDPATAADVANAYAEVFVEDRRTRSAEALLAKVEELRTQSAEATAELEQIAARLAAPGISPGDAASLQTRQANLQSQVQEYDRRADEFAVEAELRGRGTQLISPAPLELDPIRSSPITAAVVGLVLGTLLGITIAVVVDTVQDRVGSRDELAEVRAGTPVLAAVPHTDFGAGGGTPSFAAQEAYRYLRTGIRVFGLNSSLRSIVVTSAVSAEGKTTTAVNLARTMADAGDRVLLVDCDLRRPDLHERFGLSNEVGLTSVVFGDATVADATHFVTDALAVIPAGPGVENPVEMLGSEAFAEVLGALVDQADFTILDSPPVLPVADALLAGRQVDGAVVVGRVGGVRRRAVLEALQRLEEAGIAVVGLIANDTDEPGSEEYYGPTEGRSTVGAATDTGA